jgi:CDGSH-type Zn-finger protein
MSVVTILVRENGPYRIALEEASLVRIIDHEGNELVPTPGKPIALCRCGASTNKPFCDGTHSQIGFRAAEAAQRAADARADRQVP